MSLFRTLAALALDEAKRKVQDNPLLRAAVDEFAQRVPVVGSLVKSYLGEEPPLHYDEPQEQDHTCCCEEEAQQATAEQPKAEAKLCKMEGCGRPSIYSIGFCRTHYQKYRRGGIDQEGNPISKAKSKPVKAEKAKAPAAAKVAVSSAAKSKTSKTARGKNPTKPVEET